MTILKLMTSKVSTFLIPTRNGLSPRVFVTASPTLSESKKEKEAVEACQNVKEAADAVKEGAKAVKKTSEYVKEVASSTAESVSTCKIYLLINIYYQAYLQS
ncbi:hypothetical protein EZV62_001090 [Acer yangbiense]|uniref:Uncharacterized protein n=1 Tax=Acer yangbiense TaxID=1000413 RepID=A0A5C7ITB1_9ROSI|nr:hypothetical protein EZV62_001090 [Acer yangbiense]